MMSFAINNTMMPFALDANRAPASGMTSFSLPNSSAMPFLQMGTNVCMTPQVAAQKQGPPVSLHHLPYVAVDRASLVNNAINVRVDRTSIVNNAINVLALEAGLSEETITALRNVVKSGMARKAEQDQENRHEGQSAALTTSAHGIADTHPASLSGSMSPCTQPVTKRTVKPSSSKRQQLTVEEAAEIYTLRPKKIEGQPTRSLVHCRLNLEPPPHFAQHFALLCLNYGWVLKGLMTEWQRLRYG